MTNILDTNSYSDWFIFITTIVAVIGFSVRLIPFIIDVTSLYLNIIF